MWSKSGRDTRISLQRMNMEEDESSSESERAQRLRDWNYKVRTPTAYRIGNSTLRIQQHFALTVVVGGAAILCLLYLIVPSSRSKFSYDDHFHFLDSSDSLNTTYPLSPVVETDPGVFKFRIAVVTDLDTKSRIGDGGNYQWIAYLKLGHLIFDRVKGKVSIEWDLDPMVTLTSSLASDGRGMELSELIAFNGKLYSVDDRTGVLYEISGGQVFPWQILADGNGRETKGFKGEWIVLKHNRLYVGGLGKEWTDVKGEHIINTNPQWIKTVTHHGEVKHHDWRSKYESLKKTVGISFPGYIIHECVLWSSVHNKWFFLPRRVSTERYDEVKDEGRGSNLVIEADDDFSRVTTTRIGPVIPTHGFSSAKFVPGTRDSLVVALKTEEDTGKLASYITCFYLNGTILYPETKIDNYKFEGIEFV